MEEERKKEIEKFSNIKNFIIFQKTVNDNL